MNAAKADVLVPIEQSAIVLATVLSNVLTALKHPHNRGPSRPMAVGWCAVVGPELVAHGLLDDSEWQEMSAHIAHEMPPAADVVKH